MIRRVESELNRALTIVITALLVITSSFSFSQITAYATQDRSGYFNANYSLSGVPQDDIVAVARAQLGMNGTTLHYSEAWCADFVSDCAKKAGLSYAIPADCSCASLYSKIIANGGYEVSSPQKGDLVFYYCNACKNAGYGTASVWCHVGLMINGTQSIEGNYSKKVTLVNGWYNQGNGHNTGNYITKKYVRPAYGGSSQSNQSSIWDGFSTDYAGTYQVTTSRLPLTLRSTPQQSGSQLALVPKGTIVNVEKANGSWAYASYNGQYGYLSIQYLTKVQQLPGTEISYWFSKTKMGDAISSVKNGERVYFCYKLTRQDNGALVDCGEYNVKQTIYFPDGSTWDNNYSNSNNNCVSFVAGQGGNYRCTINLTGDWSGDYELTLYNVPSVKKVLSEDWFSSSPMGAKLNKLEKGKDYYYCFSIINEGSGYLNDTIYRNYTVTDNLYSPDGRRVNGWTENRSDRHYLKFTASQTGKYYGKYTVKFDGNSPVNVDGEKIDCVDTTPVLSKITVTKLPSKTSYYIGDKFDKTGMVVTASYSNGSSKAVTGYTVATNTSSVGTKNVRVFYTEGGISKTTSFDIYVQKKEEKKIKISFDLNGGQNESGSSELADAEIIKGSKFIVPYENPVKYVNIAFDSNGGDSTPDSMKIKEPLRRWEYYDSAYGLINTVTAGNRIVLNNDTTFKAIYGGHLDNLPQVTKKGYTFNGWYLNGKKYQNELIDSDIELVAHWTKNSNDDDTTVPDNKDSDDITGDLNKKNNDSDHSGNQTVDDGSNNSGNQTVDDGSDEFNVDTDDQDEDSDAVEIGDELEVGDAVYTILTIGDSATVEYTEYEGTAKKVVIPNEIAQDGKVYTVISVGDKAFYKNKDMTAVSIGKNVTKIGSKAFYGCSKLKQIVVYSKNITSISSKAFQKIQKSVKVLLPKSKYTSYKKLFKKAGISVKAKFKKIKL